MKKIFFIVFILAFFISIFCLSSSALEYGQQFLDPDYYEDDIVMVIGLYFDGDSWLSYPGNSGTQIFIPLYQIRVPESSGSQEYYAHLFVNDWTTESDGMFEFVIDFTLYEGSFASEYGSTVVDLSDFLVSGLQDYAIQSTLWDDPYFFLIDSSGFSEVTVGSNVDPISSQLIFFGLYCDIYHSYIPLPEPPTLQIPTYPARPIVPEPDPDPVTPTEFLSKMFIYPLDTTFELFGMTGTFGLYLSIITFVLFVRFIIMPIIGGRMSGFGSGMGSDRVKKRSNKDD